MNYKWFKFLLKDTKLKIKMSGIDPTSFSTNTRLLQGDGLSGVLFSTSILRTPS